MIYAGIHLTRDAPAGAALLLASLAARGESLSTAAARWPGYSIVRAKLPLARVDEHALLERAAGAFDGADVDTTDGLRFAWPGHETWLHLRTSGTEPVVRAIAESRERERAQRLVDRVRELAG